MRFLSIVSALLFFHSGSIAFPEFKDTIIAPVPGGSDLYNGEVRYISEYGDLQMLPYFENYTNPKRLGARFENLATGSISQIPIDTIEAGDIPNSMLFDSQEMIVAYDSYKPKCLIVNEYQLQGTDVPDSAVLVGSHHFGDSKSNEIHTLKLSSGALVIMWYEFETLPDNSMDMGFAYRSPDKVWSPELKVNVPSVLKGYTSCRLALVQHPADNTIWAFAKRDSHKNMIAIHFTEEADSLRVDWVKNDFVDFIRDGFFAPEAERPHLTAVPAPERNSILLGYQNRKAKVFPSLDILKGAYITIVEIKDEDDFSFIQFTTWIERVNRFALATIGQHLYMAARPIMVEDSAFNDLFVYQYDFQAAELSAPVHLGKVITPIRDNIIPNMWPNQFDPIIVSPNRPVFSAKMNDGFMHIFDFTEDSVTNVRRAILPKEKRIFFSSDPTNSSVNFTYRLPSAQPVQLSIYTPGGKLIETVVNDVRPPGTHRADWNYGPGASGVYLLNMRMGDEETVQKILLSR